MAKHGMGKMGGMKSGKGAGSMSKKTMGFGGKLGKGKMSAGKAKGPAADAKY